MSRKIRKKISALDSIGRNIVTGCGERTAAIKTTFRLKRERDEKGARELIFARKARRKGSRDVENRPEHSETEDSIIFYWEKIKGRWGLGE